MLLELIFPILIKMLHKRLFWDTKENVHSYANALPIRQFMITSGFLIVYQLIEILKFNPLQFQASGHSFTTSPPPPGKITRPMNVFNTVNNNIPFSDSLLLQQHAFFPVPCTLIVPNTLSHACLHYYQSTRFIRYSPSPANI